MENAVRYKRRQLRNRGFTLVEVLTASVLLIIALVPILKALTSAQVTAAIIERRTRSLVLAEAKLDEIKARSIYNYTGTFTEANTCLDGAYLCNVRDRRISPNLRRITVSVGYDLNGNSALQPGEVEVTLATLMARRWGTGGG
jgi:Tfp pilus assembly protein PilV